MQSENISDKIAWRTLNSLIQSFNFNEAEIKILMGGVIQFEDKLNRDQKERISYLLGIYKNLLILFTDNEQALTWIGRENSLPPFNGITPKQYMLEGSQHRLAEVRHFLDFWRDPSLHSG